MATDGHTKSDKLLDFILITFFSKDSASSSTSGNKIDFFFFSFFGHGTLKQAQSLKKGSESVKHNTKAGII